jgi:hypothetical protein
VLIALRMAGSLRVGMAGGVVVGAEIGVGVALTGVEVLIRKVLGLLKIGKRR